jgi:hypothetical protein
VANYCHFNPYHLSLPSFLAKEIMGKKNGGKAPKNDLHILSRKLIKFSIAFSLRLLIETTTL